jgi:hypothetical protein
MEITLNRQPSFEETTLGTLFIDGEFECFTLEDTVRPNGVKIYGETAIPAGRYQVIYVPSQAFGRKMPRLVNIPGFSGVLIHWGNSKEDTLGCIIAGSRVSDAEHVTGSRVAFDALDAKIEKACALGDVWIDVRDAVAAEPAGPEMET